MISLVVLEAIDLFLLTGNKSKRKTVLQICQREAIETFLQ